MHKRSNFIRRGRCCRHVVRGGSSEASQLLHDIHSATAGEAEQQLRRQRAVEVNVQLDLRQRRSYAREERREPRTRGVHPDSFCRLESRASSPAMAASPPAMVYTPFDLMRACEKGNVTMLGRILDQRRLDLNRRDKVASSLRAARRCMARVVELSVRAVLCCAACDAEGTDAAAALRAHRP
jgi:hypothetical protein